jgi:hypothetical protein
MSFLFGGGKKSSPAPAAAPAAPAEPSNLVGETKEADEKARRTRANLSSQRTLLGLEEELKTTTGG